MASYRAVEPPLAGFNGITEILALTDVATSFEFKPNTRKNWSWNAVEPPRSGFDGSEPKLYMNQILFSDEYVWIGPGGSLDADNAYWG